MRVPGLVALLVKGVSFRLLVTCSSGRRGLKLQGSRWWQLQGLFLMRVCSAARFLGASLRSCFLRTCLCAPRVQAALEYHNFDLVSTGACVFSWES